MKVQVCRGSGGVALYAIFAARRKVVLDGDYWRVARDSGGVNDMPVVVCPTWFHRMTKLRLKPGEGPVIADATITAAK